MGHSPRRLIRSWRDRAPGDPQSAILLSDATLEDVDFESCVLSLMDDPAIRTTVRGVAAINCSVGGCIVGGPVVEDAIVENLKTHGLLQVWGAAFRHVTLRGRLGRIMLSALAHPGINAAEATSNASFRQANSRYYAGVDWALDIRDADAEELELAGVPARLIRRDPATAIVVRAPNLRSDWEQGIEGTSVYFAIKRIIDHDLDDVVIAACRR